MLHPSAQVSPGHIGTMTIPHLEKSSFLSLPHSKALFISILFTLFYSHPLLPSPSGSARANNQDQTINRLLRAQTSKSRSKLDAPAESTSNSPAPPGTSAQVGDESGEVELKPKTRGRELPVNDTMIRFVSRLNAEGGLINLVAVTEGREGWIAV